MHHASKTRCSAKFLRHAIQCSLLDDRHSEFQLSYVYRPPFSLDSYQRGQNWLQAAGKQGLSDNRYQLMSTTTTGELFLKLVHKWHHMLVLL